jgi:hypothetical protein
VSTAIGGTLIGKLGALVVGNGLGEFGLIGGHVVATDTRVC